LERIFVDTSGWVALFVQNDQNHSRAASIFQKLGNEKAQLFTSDYVIDETITTILVRSNHYHSVVAGKALLTSSVIKIISVYPDSFKSSWELYQKFKDKKFSFTDVTSLTIIKNLNIQKAFAFDMEFIQAGIQLL